MAKLETTLTGSFDEWVRKIEEGIINGNVSADIEDSSDFYSADGKSRCSVRVFERYSIIGANRVSLTVTLFQYDGGPIQCSAISSGGSQAVFFKINTWGEESFMDKFSEIIK